MRNKFYLLDLWSLLVRVLSFLTVDRLTFQNHNFLRIYRFLCSLESVGAQLFTCPPRGGIIPTHWNSLRKLVLVTGDRNRIFFVLVITWTRENLLQSYTSKPFGLKTSYWVTFSLALSLLIVWRAVCLVLCHTSMVVGFIWNLTESKVDVDFGGLGVACWPLVPKFAGSNPAEAVGFLRAKKSSARLPSQGK